MRTTLNLPDALMERLKAHARARGQTVTSVVERAMRDALDAADADRHTSDVDLPDYPVFGDPTAPRRALSSDDLHELLHGEDSEGSSEQRLVAQVRADQERRYGPLGAP